MPVSTQMEKVPNGYSGRYSAPKPIASGAFGDVFMCKT
jgi:hypothetical protein